MGCDTRELIIERLVAEYRQELMDIEPHALEVHARLLERLHGRSWPGPPPDDDDDPDPGLGW